MGFNREVTRSRRTLGTRTGVTPKSITPPAPPSAPKNSTPLKTGGVTTNAGYNSLLGAQGLYGYRNQMLEDAYGRQKDALNGAYDAYLSALADNLNSTKGALNDAYSRSKASIMDDSRNSLKQAYINKVLQEKNLDQTMAAQGLSGGATETTRASMSNNYGNARNEINRTTNNNLSTLEGEYNQNLAAAQQAYNSAVANAMLQKAQQEAEIENALISGQIDALDNFLGGFGDDGSYMEALQSVLNNGSSYDWNPTSATNAVNPLELQMGGGNETRARSNVQKAIDEVTNGTPQESSRDRIFNALARKQALQEEIRRRRMNGEDISPFYYYLGR